MACKSFPFNSTVRIRGKFRTVPGGVLTNTTATLKVRKADGTETTYSSPTNESTGVYVQAGIVLNVAGDWYYRWIGATGVDTAREFHFQVEGTKFAAP